MEVGDRIYPGRPCTLCEIFSQALKFFVRRGMNLGDGVISVWEGGRQQFYQVKSPELNPGGWAFEFLNDWYPDVDDSGIVMMAIKEVKVKVINVDREKKRIGLSLRALQEDPWRSRVEKYSVGQLVEGDRVGRRFDRPLAGQHDALRGAGGARGVENDRGVGALAGRDLGISDFGRGSRFGPFHGMVPT